MQIKQNVPDGYKLTEVGVIPEDWGVGQLDEFWSVTDCKHVTAKFIPNGFPLASIKEVQSRFVDLSKAKHTTYDYYKLLTEGRRVLAPGDLILSRNATVGEVAQVMSWHPVFAMGQDVCLLRSRAKEYSSSFLQELFAFSSIKQQLDDCMVGTTFKRVNVKQVKSLKVQMPKPEEQAVIAGALSDVATLITSLEKLLAKKRALKTATMQQLLTGKKRLPPFDKSHTGYKQTELGEIPKGWEVVFIGDLADVKTGPFGSSLHESDYVANGTPIITVEHLGDMGVTYQNLPKVSDRDKSRLKAYSLKVGDIAFSRVGSVDRNALISTAEEGWLFSGRILRVRFNSDVAVASFFSHQFHTRFFKNRVFEVAVGQTMASLNTSILKNIKVLKPRSLLEQEAISNVLTEMNEDIVGSMEKLNKLKGIKQSMMQELLTGKTRLVAGTA